MLIALKHKIVVEKFVKNVYGEKHSFIEWTYVEGAHWNCLNEAIPMFSNNMCYWNFMNYAFAKLEVAWLLWASTQENRDFVLCEQQMRWSAFASAHTDQRLCYLLSATHDI